jgi:hypothetical protein
VAKLSGMMGYATGRTAQIMRAMAAHPDRVQMPGTNAGKRVVAPWKPFVPPTRPPSNTYDPTLDANLRGAQRGYEDTKADATLADTNNLADALIRIKKGRELTDWGNADDMQGLGRLQADVGTRRTQAWQDFATDKGNRERNYADLGARQGEQASLAGVSQGGTLAASLAARAANQGREQAVADTGFQRENAALDQQVQRGKEDVFRSVYRRNTGQTEDEAGTMLGYTRAHDKGVTDVTRAGRELINFTQDTGASRFFQASQPGTGWQAPQRPANERGSGANAYRVVTVGGRRVKVNAAGRVIGRA